MPDQESAIKLYNMLKEDVDCHPFLLVSGQKGVEENPVDGFKNAEDGILVAVNMLSEGIDIPDMKTMILASATRSQIELNQRVGRLIRNTDACRKSRNRKHAEKTLIWYYYEDSKDDRTKCTYKTGGKGYDGVAEQKQAEVEVEKKRKTKYLTAPTYQNETESKKFYFDFYQSVQYINLNNLIQLFENEKFTEEDGCCGCFVLDAGEKIYVNSQVRQGYLQLGRDVLVDVHMGIPEKILSENTLDEIRLQCFYLGVRSVHRKYRVSNDEIKKFVLYVVEKRELPQFEYAREISIYTGVRKWFTGRRIDLYLDRNSKIVSVQDKSGFEEWFCCEDVHKAFRLCFDKCKKEIKKEYPDIKTDDEFGVILESLIENRYRIFFRIERRRMQKVVSGQLPRAVLEEIINSAERRRNEPKEGQPHMNSFKTYYGYQDDLYIEDIKRGYLPVGKPVDGRAGEKLKNIFGTMLPNKYIRDPNINIKRIANGIIKNKHRYVVTDEDAKEFKESVKEYFRQQKIPIRDNLAEDICKVILGVAGAKGISAAIKSISDTVASDAGYEPALLKGDLIRILIQDSLYSMLAYSGKAEALVGVGTDTEVWMDYEIDSHQYKKVLQHYRGIKPEFLCRLNNLIFRQAPDYANRYFSGCGGSGADIFNLYVPDKNISGRTYNELGTGLKLFYEELQETSRKITALVKDVIDNILSEGEALPDKLKFLAVQGVDNDGVWNSSHNEFLERETEKFINNYVEYIDKDMQESFSDYIIKVQKKLHKVYTACEKISGRLLGTSEEYGFSREVAACAVFICKSFSSRQIFKGCTIYNFVKFCTGYEKWLESGHKELQNVNIKQGDVMELLKLHKDDEDCYFYIDVPYIGTCTSEYARAESGSSRALDGGFDHKRFTEMLNEIKGFYTVAERYNIVLSGQKKGYDIDMDDLGNKDRDKVHRIAKFYERFAKSAKYAVIPFIPASMEYAVENKGGAGILKNTYNFDYLSILRMFKRTMFSDLKAEVMITNVDLLNGRIERLNRFIRFYKVEEGIYMFPTYIAGYSYYSDPVTIVMKYGRFMELLGNIPKPAPQWTAEHMRKYFNKKFEEAGLDYRIS